MEKKYFPPSYAALQKINIASHGKTANKNHMKKPQEKKFKNRLNLSRISYSIVLMNN